MRTILGRRGREGGEVFRVGEWMVVGLVVVDVLAEIVAHLEDALLVAAVVLAM